MFSMGSDGGFGIVTAYGQAFAGMACWINRHRSIALA